MRMAKLAGNSTLVLIFALAAVIISTRAVNGDAGAAATPTTICKVGVSELAVCIPAITGKSPPKPTESCCAVIRKADLRCLCNYRSQFTKFGINPDNALALPKKCGLKLPRGCKKMYLH